MPDLIVVQHGTGSALDLHKMFGSRTKAWAERHGCRYLFSDRRTYTDRTPHWEKPLLIKELLDASQDGDEILWMDPDTFVRDTSVSPVGVLRANLDIALCGDSCATPFNTGLYFIRANARTRRFIADVVRLGPIPDFRFHDQGRMCQQIEEHQLGVQVLPHIWNSAHCTRWYKQPKTGVIIEAFHGVDKDLVKIVMERLMSSSKTKLEKKEA